jgi:ABC-type transport system involved in cytochrome bd biosynthesis fused ATPase/permease subunit
VSDAAGVGRAGLAALRRVQALLAGAAAEPVEQVVPDSTPVVDGLRFTFPGSSRPALRVPAFRAALVPGSSLAVVGGSGAGKSTLLRLLAGELVPESGEVRLGPTSLAGLSPEQRSRVVSLATQDAHVFDAGLGDNLRIGRPDASDDELLEALEVVGLRAWAVGLEEGLRTPLGHRGVRLSGGQRKRLCVARAWLSAAPVLLLDEPTEGLHPDEADALVRALLAASRDRALVLVTHRVVALDGVDDVLVLQSGRAAQHGPPAALRRVPGLFAEAWALQSEPAEAVPRAG